LGGDIVHEFQKECKGGRSEKEGKKAIAFADILCKKKKSM